MKPLNEIQFGHVASVTTPSSGQGPIENFGVMIRYESERGTVTVGPFGLRNQSRDYDVKISPGDPVVIRWVVGVAQVYVIDPVPVTTECEQEP